MSAEQKTNTAFLRRLEWRCRRGLLENDIILQRFFLRHGDSLSTEEITALDALMDLPDNDLLRLFLNQSSDQHSNQCDESEAICLLLKAPSTQQLLKKLQAV